MNYRDAIWKASAVYAPAFPRQSSSGRTMQAERTDRNALHTALVDAVENEMPGYYSVYSFPRGHSRDGNTPRVDCIFIDLDLDGGDYDPDADDPDFDSWKRDMSALLTRSRMIARAITDAGKEQHFRATLSGHKGLHLYLDFPSVSPENGDFLQFKRGLHEYGKRIMNWLDSAAGGVNIDRWVDVDGSDLGRLARHPNTRHFGAKYDSTERWAIPVTIEELTSITVDDYLALTESPRWTDDITRVPSQSAGKKVVQSIRTAEREQPHRSRSKSTTYNSNQVQDYKDRQNDDIEVDDVPFLTANYPCVREWLENPDAFNHGHASHIMEINVIGKLVSLNVPRDVIHELFSDIPGYTERQTDDQIDAVIGRDYQGFNCSKIANRAPMFCLGERCSVYQRNDDIQK